jgi:hypothetical protein
LFERVKRLRRQARDRVYQRRSAVWDDEESGVGGIETPPLREKPEFPP